MPQMREINKKNYKSVYYLNKRSTVVNVVSSDQRQADGGGAGGGACGARPARGGARVARARAPRQHRRQARRAPHAAQVTRHHTGSRHHNNFRWLSRLGTMKFKWNNILSAIV